MENGARNHFQLGINIETDTLSSWRAKAGPHYSREFVTEPLRCQARRAREAVREGAYLREYVDRLSGEPVRRQACRSGVSAVAVEVFVNNAGE